MEVQPARHPPPELLRAFGLGTLDDAAAGTVLSHLEQCPECCRAVAAQPGDDFLERFVRVREPSATPASVGALAPSASRLAETTSGGPTPLPDLPTELIRHPQYELIRELGRGGMGVVYLARNRQMDRLEVLKVMGRDVVGRSGARARFEREIKAAARLNHPNIVTAYSVLPLEGLLVLAMEHVEGRDLARVVEEEGPLSVARACAYAQQAALGLQHAHERGMVHRDIKPHNLICSRVGQRHVIKVLDFGLAKALREKTPELHLTGEGTTLGTPEYVAPEQIRDAARVDIRADLYSLGCTLYFLLTGQPPFAGRGLYGLLNAHLHVEARALDQVRPDVPAKLAAVVRKLLAKDPDQRYATPLATAQALTPFARSARAGAASSASAGGSASTASIPALRAAQTPVPGPAGRRRWRLPLAIAAGLVLVFLAVLWAVGVFRMKTPNGTIPSEDVTVSNGGHMPMHVKLEPLASVPAGSPPRTTTHSPPDALRRDQIAADELATAGLGDPAAAPAELVAILGDSRLKHWHEATTVSFSKDGKLLASGSMDGTACVWDAVTGKLRWAREADTGGECVTTVAFAPDGKTLATGGPDKTVKLWEPETGRPLGTIDPKPAYPRALAFSPDGRLLAIAPGRPRVGKVVAWEVATRRPYRDFAAPEDVIEAVAFSPDGKSLAACGGRWWGPAQGRAETRVWDVQTGQQRLVVEGHGLMVSAVCFSPDSKLLATGSWDATARLWDARTGAELQTLRQRNRVVGLAFTSDGETLATACLDRAVRFWDVASGRERRAIWDNAFFALSFRPDGQVLASAGWNHMVRLWNPATCQPVSPSAGSARAFSNDYSGCSALLAVASDGTMLASVEYGESPRVRLWDLATGKLRQKLGRPGAFADAVALSPDKKLLAVGYHDGRIRLWDVATGQVRAELTGHHGLLRALAFSADGQLLASGGEDRTVRLWDVPRGEAWLTLGGHRDWVQAFAFTKDGKLLASAGADRTIKLWDLTTSQERATLHGHAGPVHALAFSPDGATLFSASLDHTVRLWDVATNEARLTVQGALRGSTTLALSLDGQTLATAGGDGHIQLRDAANGRPRLSLRIGPSRGLIHQLAFTPDGRYLVTVNGNGTLYVLRMPALP